MTTTDTIDYDTIEPGVRELCRVLDESGLPIRTLWASAVSTLPHGLLAKLLGRPAQVMSMPFVILTLGGRSHYETREMLERALFRVRMSRCCRFDWDCAGNFFAQLREVPGLPLEQWERLPVGADCEQRLACIRPCLRSEKWFASSLGDDRLLEHDLATLPGLLATAIRQVLATQADETPSELDPTTIAFEEQAFSAP